MKTQSFHSLRTAFLPLVLLVVGWVVYVGSLSAPFIFDDYTTIVKNPDIGNLFSFPRSSRPFVDFTFRLNYAISGKTAADFRFVNILIHLFAGLFFFGILRRTFKTSQLRVRFSESGDSLAFFAAALWIVHPLQTESVTYICQRYESMMGMFFMMSLYCFVRGTQSRHARFWHDMGLGACGLGMLCKEVMAAAPVVLFVYDYVFLSTSVVEVLRQRWKVHLANFLTLGMLASMLMLASARNILSGNLLMGMGAVEPLQYLMTQSKVILHYLRLSVVPYPLVLDYAWLPVAGIKEVFVSVTALCVCCCTTLVCAYKRIPIGFLGLSFFVILAPTSSFFPVTDIAFEHRMYLPLVTPVTLAVLYAYALYSAFLDRISYLSVKAVFRWIAFAGSFGIFISYCSLTVQRNGVYQSAERMWRDVVDHRPENIRAAVSLAEEVLAARRFTEAETMARSLLTRLERMKLDSRAWESIPKGTGWTGDDLLYGTLRVLGESLLYQGRIQECLGYFEQALKISPNKQVARVSMAYALLLAGDLANANQQAEWALRENPSLVQAYAVKGLIASKQGDYPTAVRSYEEAIALKPDYISAQVELAWLLAVAPQPNVRNGTRALQIAAQIGRSTQYQSVRVLEILAAAYAECGDFELARQHVSSAIRLQQGGNIASTQPTSDAFDEKKKTLPSMESETQVDVRLFKARAAYDLQQPFRLELGTP